MDKEKMEKLEKLLANMDRISKSGQDLAASAMDREPSQRRQNGLWRYLIQDLRDVRKILASEEAE